MEVDVCLWRSQTLDRHKTWDMLKHVKSSSHLPYVCIGGFNEVLHRPEHHGVQEKSNAQISGFQDVEDVRGMYDLGYEGRG